jgi:hypothetical protein
MSMEPLGSEQVILAAPMSWAGSTRRIWRWYRPAVAASAGWPKAGRWTLLWTMLIGAWVGVAAMYAALAFVGLIPLIVLIIFRLVRRSQRHAERAQLRHAELMRRLPPQGGEGT